MSMPPDLEIPSENELILFFESLPVPSDDRAGLLRFEYTGAGGGKAIFSVDVLMCSVQVEFMFDRIASFSASIEGARKLHIDRSGNYEKLIIRFESSAALSSLTIELKPELKARYSSLLKMGAR